MNKQKLLDLADLVEKLPPEHFTMKQWIVRGLAKSGQMLCFEDVLQGCGTAACLAGYCCLREGYCSPYSFTFIKDGYEYYPSELATKILEITSEGAEMLFYLRHWPKQFREVSRARWTDEERFEESVGMGHRPEDEDFTTTPQLAAA